MARTNTTGSSGPGTGTVTSIQGLKSIINTPNPITGAGTIELEGDAITPGVSKYWGTGPGSATTKGFFSLPSPVALPPIFLVVYGSTTNMGFASDVEVGFTGGSGATTINLPITGVIVGDLVIVGDAGINASGNNITIDSRTGNKIVGVTSAQTYVITNNGDVLYLRLIDITAGVFTWKIQ